MDNPRGMNEKHFLIRDNINGVNNAADNLMEIKDAPIIKTKKRGRPKKERLHEVFPNEPQRNFKFKSVPIAPYKYQGHQKKIVQSSYETLGPSNQQQSREIFESKQNNNVNKRVEGNDKLCEFLPKETSEKYHLLKLEIEPVVPPDGYPKKLLESHKVCEEPGPSNHQQSREIFLSKQINYMNKRLEGVQNVQKDRLVKLEIEPVVSLDVHKRKLLEVHKACEKPRQSKQQQSREIIESKQINYVNKRLTGKDKLCEFLPKEAVQKDRVLKIEIEPVVPPDGHPRKLSKLHKVCEKPGPTNQQQSRRIPRNTFKYKQINDMKESLDNKDKLCIKEPSSTTLSKDANETPVTITIININDILNNKIILDDGSDYKYNDESDDEFDDEYDNDSF